jgi:hypothetical protein
MVSPYSKALINVRQRWGDPAGQTVYAVREDVMGALSGAGATDHRRSRDPGRNRSDRSRILIMISSPADLLPSPTCPAPVQHKVDRRDLAGRRS